MHSLLPDATARALRYLDGLATRSVAPTPAAVAQLAAFETPLPDHPVAPAETLRVLDEIGSPATTRLASGPVGDGWPWS